MKVNRSWFATILGVVALATIALAPYTFATAATEPSTTASACVVE